MSSNQIRFSIGYDQGPRLMPVSEFAHLAEDLGYDGITLASGSTSFDPIIILAQLASASERLLLSITVQVLPLIHPLLLAKQIATIDQVSNGRAIIGVGIGGDRPIQFKNMGSSGPHHQDSGEAKIRECTAGVSRKPSSDGKACGCSSKHLCGLTAWNT